jgi:hypothetical protein
MPYEIVYPSAESKIKELNDAYDQLDVSGHYDDMSKKRGVKNDDWSQSLDYRWVLSKEAEQLQKYLLDLAQRFVDHCNSLFFSFFS